MSRKGGRANCRTSGSCICLNAWAAMMAVCNGLPCTKACSIVWCCNLIGHARRQWPHAGGLLLPGILGCAMPRTHCCWALCLGCRVRKACKLCTGAPLLGQDIIVGGWGLRQTCNLL